MFFLIIIVTKIFFNSHILKKQTKEIQISCFTMKFEEIYKLYYNEMKRFAVQLKVNETEKDDLLQDVFVKLYYEFQSNNLIENPRAWLYKTMLNKVRTNFRTTKAHKIIEQEVSFKKINYSDMSNDMENNERKKIVLESIDKMAENDKEILLLYYDGFSYSEIAEITGINYTSIGTTLVRAIQKIKNVLKLQYNEMFE